MYIIERKTDQCINTDQTLTQSRFTQQAQNQLIMDQITKLRKLQSKTKSFLRIIQKIKIKM